MDALLNYRVLFYNFYLTKIVIIFDAHTPIFTIFLFTSKKKKKTSHNTKKLSFFVFFFFFHSFVSFLHTQKAVD